MGVGARAIGQVGHETQTYHPRKFPFDFLAGAHQIGVVGGVQRYFERHHDDMMKHAIDSSAASGNREPAVDRQDLAGRRARIAAGEKQRRTGDVFRLHQSE
ncbi:Uncharacterised protein [Bordetella trematum]|nr:Uncharacterised protein [Bordetella trematum]